MTINCSEWIRRDITFEDSIIVGLKLLKQYLPNPYDFIHIICWMFDARVILDESFSTKKAIETNDTREIQCVHSIHTKLPLPLIRLSDFLSPAIKLSLCEKRFMR